MVPAARTYPLLILGAGPVGCAAAHVLNAPAVGEVLGGHLEGPPAGPFLLWRDPATARYLSSLNVPAEEVLIKFGYLRGTPAAPLFTEYIAPAARASYYRRTRGLPETAPVPESAMSSGLGGAVESYAVPRETLRAAVTRPVTFLKAKITGLSAGRDPEGFFWTVLTETALGASELRARRLVTTLPAPVFYKLCAPGADRPAERFLSREKIFLVPRDRVAAPYVPPGYDYAYAADEGFLFDRVTRVGEAREVYEFNDRARAEAFAARWHGYELDRLVNPYGQVVSRDDLPLPVPAAVPTVLWEQLRAVGRLARWQHGERLHTALRDLYALKETGFPPLYRPG